MLGQRVLTALVLLALLVPALLAEPKWPFLTLILLLVAAAGWEWSRLCGVSSKGAFAFAAGLAAACVLGLALDPVSMAARSAWVVIGMTWVLGGAWALHRGVAGWKALPPGLRWGFGAPLLWAVWMAIAAARDMGVVFLLSCLVLVWVADIAAYFGGRLIGGPKLAANISPGKTWSGAFTGLVAVLIVAAVWQGWASKETAPANLVGRLVDRWGPAPAALALAGLTAMSVVGDLFESLVKRAAGVKDSSGLLPGHGGVLDRVDALLPVLPLCIMLTL